MRHTVTTLCMLSMLFLSTFSLAQERPVLGDDFIFFVDGVNIRIPHSDADVVDDPLGTPNNKVARFNFANWSEPGFAWEPQIGVDASANQQQGDTLFIRIMSSPDNRGKAVMLRWLDKTNFGDPVNDPDNADLPFRLNWYLPAWVSDGQWHELAIPLPPATLAELDSLKKGKKVDGTPLDTPPDSLMQYWAYGGAWSQTASIYIPPDPNNPLFREFEWDAIWKFGVNWDYGAPEGGGPIYVDYMWIGGSHVDITQATQPPSPMSNIDVRTDGPVNVVSWMHNPEFGGYTVYASEFPITNVHDTARVARLGTVLFDGTVRYGKNAQTFEFRHRTEVPHGSMNPVTLYYAVTSMSQFGVENTDVSNSTASVTNTLPAQPFIFQLTTEEADAIAGAIESGSAALTGWPTEQFKPFVLDTSHASFTAGVGPVSAEDISATIWMGYTDLNEFMLNIEVRDDARVFAPEGSRGGDAWNFDSFELWFGLYEVTSWLVGSTHQDLQRGAEPDFMLRFVPFQQDGQVIRVGVWEWAGPATAYDGENPAIGVAFEETDTGYRIQAVVPLEEVLTEGDTPFQVPGPTEIKVIPLTFNLNDNDTGQREHALNWSIKPNVTVDFWNTPAQWASVALAGRQVSTASEDETLPGGSVTLLDNYPNPFSKETAIQFRLERPSDVTLEVYNVLGQRIAVLAEQTPMPSGTHRVTYRPSDLGSGVLFYRLVVDGKVYTRKMLLVK